MKCAIMKIKFHTFLRLLLPTMGAGELTKTTAIKNNYRGLGRAVGRSDLFLTNIKKKNQWRRHGFGFPVRLFGGNIRRHLFLLTLVA